MKTISQTIRNNKYGAIVPLIIGCFLLLLLMVKFEVVLIILSIISFGFSIGIYFLATKKWKIEFDEDTKRLIISDKSKSYEIMFSNISYLNEYSHFTPKGGRPYTNYSIDFLEPINNLKSISFSIYDHETELLKNCDHLKALIIIERSKRAKERIKAGNSASSASPDHTSKRK